MTDQIDERLNWIYQYISQIESEIKQINQAIDGGQDLIAPLIDMTADLRGEVSGLIGKLKPAASPEPELPEPAPAVHGPGLGDPEKVGPGTDPDGILQPGEPPPEQTKPLKKLHKKGAVHENTKHTSK